MLKFCNSIGQQFWKTQQWPQDGKRSVFIPITKKGKAKERSNYYTISLISNNSKGSKFSNWGFNTTWTESFQMFKLDLEMAEESEIKLPTSLGSCKKLESSGKTITSALLTTPQPLICESQETVENSYRDGNTRLPYLSAEKSVCMSRSNSENWTCDNGLIPN